MAGGKSLREKKPWRVYTGEFPSTDTLVRWREKAQALAQKREASGACEICFKPLAYRRGVVSLCAPVAASPSPYKLLVCRDCYESVRRFVDELTAELHLEECTTEKDGGSS